MYTLTVSIGMNEHRRHVLIGVLASLVATPFVGGGLVSYLNAYTIKKGMIVGAALGASVGLLFGGLRTIYLLLPIFELTGGSLPGSWLTGMLVSYLVGLVVIGMVSGILGGGIGSYVRHHNSAAAETRPSA